MDGTLTRVAALRCRTSDRTPGGARGAEALALALDPAAQLVGEFGDARIADYTDDLRDSRACIERAGELVGELLDAGAFPVLTSSDCTICLATFPAVAQRVPGVQILWLDAHGDSNTPETTPSGFLGGMCLGASVGRWDAGFPAAIDPDDVIVCGARQLDPGEPVPEIFTPDRVPYELTGRPVYVHLDLDVLDPEVFPSQFAEPDGLSEAALRAVLREVRQAADVVGLEITAYDAPEDPEERERRTAFAASIVRELLA